MADTLKFRKGTESKLPAAVNGQVLFTTDTNKLYVDDGSSHKLVAGNAVVDITRSGTTFTMTKLDGTTDTFTQQDNNTTYSAGSGLSLSGTTFSHADTSSQASLTASNRTYIKSLTLDTYGHVTALTTGTETVTDTNTTYSAGTGISLSGTTFSNSGVRSVATGSGNGTISVNTNGTAADVAVKNVIHTGNIGSQSVNYATSAGSANAVAWGNVSGKPSTYPPASHSHSYLPLSGGVMTGAICTSFKNSTAMGSYQAAATTVQGLVDEVRYSSGAMGSVSIGTNYTATSGGTISAGWYNFIYSPHRSGGVSGAASGDNHQYGTLILSGMTDNFGTWVIRVSGGSIGDSRRVWKGGDSVTGAVWNDYAECRESDCYEAGYVLSENGDDTLSKSNERLAPFAGVSSDTWGFSQGETEKAKTHIAVAGRVLVYPYQDRNNYKPGDCVCTAPGGTVDIMTREEVREWPDRIVGTVSCVPDYETWGGGEGADRDPVEVNGRIWIKVR